MMHRYLVRALAHVLLLQSVVGMPGDSHLRSNRQLPKNEKANEEANEAAIQEIRSTSTIGDRVSQIDISDATCMATTESPDTGFGLTSIQFYYAIESSETVEKSQLLELESILFVLISTGILWCTLPAAPPVDIGNRLLSDIVGDSRRKSIYEHVE